MVRLKRRLPTGLCARSTGSFTTVDDPGDLATGLYHINDLGEVRRKSRPTPLQTSHGVLLHPDGKLVTFEAPNAADTYGGFTLALNLKGSFTVSMRMRTAASTATCATRTASSRSSRCPAPVIATGNEPVGPTQLAPGLWLAFH